MIMEDNTEYLSRKIWWKILPSVFLGDLIILLVMRVGIFFLIAHFCSGDNLVIYSSFLPFLLFVAMMDSFFAYAGPQVFSVFKGAENQVRAQEIFREVLTTLLVFLTVFLSIVLIRMDLLVAFLKIPERMVPEAISFGRLFFLSLGLNIVASTLRNFLRSDSLPRAASVCTITGCSVYFILVCLAFTLFHAGILALPITMILGDIVSSLGYAVFFVSKKTTVHFRFRLMRWNTFKWLFKHSCGRLLACLLAFVVGTYAVRSIFAAYGSAAITILALCNLMMCCCYDVTKSFVFSMQSLCSVYFGEKNMKGLAITFKKGLKDGLLLQIAIAAVGWIFAPQIVRILPVQENFAGEAVIALYMCMISFPFSFLYLYFPSFFNISGHSKMVVICAIISDGVIYALTFLFFLFVLKDEHYFWAYFPVSWALCAMTPLIAAMILKCRNKLNNILLIRYPKIDFPAYYFLMKTSDQEFQDYSVMLNAFLKKHRIDSRNIIRAMHLLEEMFLFAKENMTQSKKNFFSVVTTIYENNVEMALRFDSKGSCLDILLNGQQRNLPPEQLAGAKLLRSLSDDIYIDRIYGYNYIRLTLFLKTND